MVNRKNVSQAIDTRKLVKKLTAMQKPRILKTKFLINL